MNIKTITKKTVADKKLFQYEIVLEDDNTVIVNLYFLKGEVLVESDRLSIPQLKTLFGQMIKNKQCKDRLRFLMMNPKTFIFMPPDPFDFSDMLTWIIE
jgi:hypothetical protein